MSAIEEYTMPKDYYETLLFEHDFQKDVILSALERVRLFLIRKGRILVGGMAIDFALKIQGSKLYESNKLPDYDFYSPEFHVDAYELGEELAAEGYENVSVIRALHVSTMKVRVNYVTVADITYIPPSIYKLLPSLEYEGIKIIHPWYQMIDQHRALSLPYENPPLETIMGKRWKIDLERNSLLYDKYSLENEAKNNGCFKIIPAKLISMPATPTQDFIFTGLAGLIKWIELAQTTFKYKLKFQNYFTPLSPNKMPDDQPVSILTDSYDEIKADEEKKPLLQILARRKYIPGIEILDNFGELRSAHMEIKTANLQHIMSYSLAKYIFYKNPSSLIHYLEARNIVEIAVELYIKSSGDEKYLPFLPSIEVYGKENINISSVVKKSEIESSVLETDKIYKFPKNAYPTQQKSIPNSSEFYLFKPEEEELYQIDGI
jgi:hypothetical protein